MTPTITVRFASNCANVLYNRQIDVNEFEKKYNLGKGFFFKATNGTVKNISIDKAGLISRTLQVSIEDLMFSDLSYLITEREIADTESEIARLQEKVNKLKGE